MRRREFIAGLGSAAAWPLIADAQQSVKIPKVGVLWHAGNEQEEAPFLGALRQGLNDHGYMEGRSIELVNLFADEHYERFATLATELVDANVDVIVASVPQAASAAKNATSTTPVIVAYGAEYLVQELAHPTGNITGLSAMLPDVAGSWACDSKTPVGCVTLCLAGHSKLPCRFSPVRAAGIIGALSPFVWRGGAQCLQPIVCFIFASRLSSSASVSYSASIR
jgi:ABC transporter substrate binding protein